MQIFANNHVVVGMEAVTNFVKNTGVFVVGDQAVSHRAIQITNIEPDTIAMVFQETAVFQNGAARETKLVAASLPATGKVFHIVALHRAAIHVQTVGPIHTKTLLAVIL